MTSKTAIARTVAQTMSREIVDQLLSVIEGAWRYRWQALILSWIVAFAGWLWVLILPDEYEAQTQVYVDTKSALVPLVKGLAIPTDVMDEVKMMTVAMLSRPQLERVARDTDLDWRATNEHEWEELLTKLRKRIKVSGDSRRSLYTIKFYDQERDMAVKVVRSLLNAFVEDTLGATTQDSTAAERFLVLQKRDYEQRLKEAEKELAEFKKANVGLMPSDRGDYYQRLQTALDAIAYTEEQLSSATRRRDELTRQISGEEPVLDIMPGSTATGSIIPGATVTGSSSLTSQDAAITEFQTELAEALLRYTERHPDVISLRETIAQLEEQRQQELRSLRQQELRSLRQQELRSSGRKNAPGLAENPVYQSMRIALSEAEVVVASLQAQLEQQQQRATKLKQLVDTVPEVEAQLAELTRGYEITTSTYEDIQRRLEQAQLSREVERAQPVGFRIIEPPIGSLEPVAPNRPLLMSAVLVGGVAFGVGLALFMSQVSPVFIDRRQLRSLTGLPVLGSVHLFMNTGERTKRIVALGGFALGFVGLTALFGVMVLFSREAARSLQQFVG